MNKLGAETLFFLVLISFYALFCVNNGYSLTTFLIASAFLVAARTAFVYFYPKFSL